MKFTKLNVQRNSSNHLQKAATSSMSCKFVDHTRKFGYSLREEYAIHFKSTANSTTGLVELMTGTVSYNCSLNSLIIAPFTMYGTVQIIIYYLKDHNEAIQPQH